MITVNLSNVGAVGIERDERRTKSTREISDAALKAAGTQINIGTLPRVPRRSLALATAYA
jgi:hypothetical protein